MADAPESKAEPTRRRRRKWPFAVAAALMVLLGQGLGWFGSAPDDEPGDEVAATGNQGAAGNESSAKPDGQPIAAAPGGAASDEGVQPAATVPDEVHEPAAQPVVSTEPAEVAEQPIETPEPQPQPDPQVTGLPADRFESLLSMVELRLTEQRLAEAGASLAHLADQQLDDDQRQQVQALRQRIDVSVRGACEAIVGKLQRGEVLAARQLSGGLLGDEGADDLARVLPQLEIEGDWRRELDVGDRLLPTAAPLSRNQRVRVHWQQQEHLGTVASNRSDKVTVRIKTASGQRYPTVLRCECEPLEATVTDAVEMALACVHAERPLMARLWLASAHLIANGVIGERGEMVRSLLR